MAKTNQIIVNPILGDKLKFLITSEDSNGEVLRCEMWLKPLAQGPPLHYHPFQTEGFEVINGKLGIEDDGKKMTIGPGENYTIQKNSAHKWYNAGEEDLHMIAEIKPALKFEFFLESMYSLAHQGKVKKNGLPGTLQFAAILNECPDELYVVGPPIAAQKFMAKVIGGFAKLIGYKGFVPYSKNN
ncbi:MAG: cupin domain-containing protein [Bacteroidota bacterium]